jgi:hypothetical protein
LKLAIPRTSVSIGRKPLAPPRHRHVEAVVDCRAIMPNHDRVERRLAMIGADEIEDSSSFRQRRRPPCR